MLAVIENLDRDTKPLLQSAFHSIDRAVSDTFKLFCLAVVRVGNNSNGCELVSGLEICDLTLAGGTVPCGRDTRCGTLP